MKSHKAAEVSKEFELVVVGGGLSGLQAAIAAARQGTKTALINNRPVLGGNASSEVKMHICGADYHMQKKNARETGIIEEILLENKYRNQTNSFYLLDSIMWEKAYTQENLELFLNAHMTEVFTENKRVKSVLVHQQTNEKTYRISGQLFVDATGDGTLGYLAGAETMSGREGQDVFGESIAPEKTDGYMMGSSIQFTSVDTGEKVDFVKPEWANTYTEEDLKHRAHKHFKDGYWWIELGGDGKLDTIEDAEEIRDELLKVVFGIWDHIKNGGDHGADNYELDWVGFLPGKRDSRRIVGDYVLKADDLLEQREFDDAIAYGGWPMDMHAVGGIRAKGEQPTIYHRLKEVYSIPYRSLYAKDLDNLFVAGRNISVSHMVFGSTRVMATCGVVGEAVGLAASIAIKKGVSPRGVGDHMKELQQLALKNDLYIPNVKNEDPQDVARQTRVSASSFSEGNEPEKVINGITRSVHKESNCWQPDNLNDVQWLDLELDQAKEIKEVSLKFDSNLSKEIMVSLSEQKTNIQDKKVQQTLVKDYDVVFYNDQEEIKRVEKRDNYLRNVTIKLDKPANCDKVRLELRTSNGVATPKVFEVRIY